MNKNIEKNNQSLTRIIGEGIFLFSAGSFINKFSSLATSLIKIKILSIFQYGLLSLTTAAVYLFNGFVTFGISTVILADLNRMRGDNDMRSYKSLLLGYIKFISFIAVILWAVLFFGAEYISTFYDNAIFPYIKILSFVLLFTPLRNLYSTIFQTHLHFNYSVKWSVLDSYLNLMFVILFVWLWKMGINGVLYAELMYNFISLVVFTPFFIKVAKYLIVVEKSEKNYFWNILKSHGKWALANNYLSDFTAKIRPWIVAFFLNVEAVAIFSVAKNIFAQLTSLVPIQNVLAQIFPQQIKDKIKTAEIFFRSFKYSLYTYLLITVMGFFIVPVLIEWLFPKYIPSILIFKLLLISLPFYSLAVLQKPMYNALQKQKSEFFVFLSTSIVMIFTNILLTPVFGVIGVACEYVVTVIFGTIARFTNLKKIEPTIFIDWHNLFSLDEVDKNILLKVKNKILRVN